MGARAAAEDLPTLGHQRERSRNCGTDAGAGEGLIATPTTPAGPAGESRKRTRAPKGKGVRLREEILAATERLLMETKDEASVSVRAIADAVGVSPPSIYLHFADKDELIHAVCQQQFRRLDDLVAETLGDVLDPLEKLRRRGHAYVRFGVEHPEHYRVMLMGKSHFGGDYDRAALPGLRSFMALVENVQECMDAGVFAPDDPAVVATLLWAAVHGITSLRIAVPGFPTFKDADDVLDRLLAALARGLAPT